MNKELYHARWRLHHATADLNYSLECFGDHLSEQEGYPSEVYGFDAVYLYLSRKHGWTIKQCREMSMEELRLGKVRISRSFLPKLTR
ncbi:hypothetical protein DN595_08375 [Enterobacter cloacae]|uniref:Uncharacterized protein n=1 Tax=Enterobacter cloacae TaxID=550 RepID=A0AB37VK79_ENTCL|nr:hypothetical protein [Enterobacter cloacae]RWT81436.1 hypothetical protein DN595_08375 [Enterobacter cloacae]